MLEVRFEKAVELPQSPKRVGSSSHSSEWDSGSKAGEMGEDNVKLMKDIDKLRYEVARVERQLETHVERQRYSLWTAVFCFLLGLLVARLIR